MSRTKPPNQWASRATPKEPVYRGLATNTSKEPKLLAEITIPSNQEAEEFLRASSIHPANIHTIGSYNWLANPSNPKKSTPTIAVPGYPACWIPPTAEDPCLQPDSGFKYICQNSYLSPSNPLLPAILAIRKCSPSFEFEDLDLFTDRNNLNKLYDFLTEFDPEKSPPSPISPTRTSYNGGGGGYKGGYNSRGGSGSSRGQNNESRSGNVNWRPPRRTSFNDIQQPAYNRVDIDFLPRDSSDSDSDSDSDAEDDDGDSETSTKQPNKVSGTMIMTRWEENNTEIVPEGQFRGFGFNFLFRHTKFYSGHKPQSTTNSDRKESEDHFVDIQKEGSGHHRMVYYEFGGMKCAVRFHADACPLSVEEFEEWAENNLDPEDNSNGGVGPNGSYFSDDSDDDNAEYYDEDELASRLGQLGLSAHPLNKDATIAVKTTPFNMFPEERIISIKTRGIGKRLDLQSTLKQTFFSQTPYLYAAYHEKGVFKPENVEIHKTGEVFPKWEEENKITLAKLCIIIKKAKDAVVAAANKKGADQGFGASLIFDNGNETRPKSSYGSHHSRAKGAVLKLYEREGHLDANVFY